MNLMTGNGRPYKTGEKCNTQSQGCQKLFFDTFSAAIRLCAEGISPQTAGCQFRFLPSEKPEGAPGFSIARCAPVLFKLVVSG
jgi:hypothetical protein